MNIIFFVILLGSIVTLTFTNPLLVMPTMLSGADSALQLAIKLFAIYAIWMSLLRVLEVSKTDKKLALILSPISRKLMPNESAECYKNINLNMSANVLGMGGVGTPLGIKAIETMTSQKNKIMLVVINSTSIQLIPTTILGMRSSLGATTDIILPSLIATFATTAIGILLVKIFVK